ncbi:hypothetical protein [Micromonospora sp. NPDC049204]|uniref:hypothetical protein n=1 Tax=Micromonospora sp. NPDC049204 TaxID=3154351 RepID=UPI0033D1DB91
MADPDSPEPDVAAVFVTRWHTPAATAAVLREVTAAWTAAPWPPGLLSLDAYAGVTAETALLYVRAADPDAYARHVSTLPGVARRTAVEYRPHRAIVLDGAPTAGCAVVADFDVDDPPRQEQIVTSVVRALEQTPPEHHRGMLSARFHLSVDGTRVLNLARWTDDAAHEAFLAGATRRATLRATAATPGVRPIGFQRYHLFRSLGPTRIKENQP